MSRAQLESGLKLDINRLLRRGFIRSGAATGPIGIKWTDTYFDEEIVSGWITADLSGTDEGWLRVNLGKLDQRILLVARKRHFGGRQWLFICPYLRGGPGCLNRFSASISGASAGVRLPSGVAAG